eukprot:CAMPEP_0170545756 /NCGR_PEP_ID=MMETSP0211-20121228/4125_1 /TAXON_ID=311385 /ORGANISM="Pseudokeronopsis sp., Strain OXSARD2" /LENGTH=87 /DNA_ID=CAMNT_0010849829 /DNA_START=54 /DNA_END=314 /DNA_ORIENTATION=+
MRTFKDCSLDKTPAIKMFLEEESPMYPDLEIFISREGEPRFDLLSKGKVVDTVKVGRHSIEGIRQLLKEFGVKRDETITWETKKAMK